MRIVLVVLSLFIAAQCGAATCGDGSRGNDREVKVVKLLKPSDGPAYYFRVSHYAFLIPADQLVSSLESKQWRSDARERLLVELKKDPVVSRTDLFKYALIDGRYLELMEHLIADMAEAGKVGLIDVWEWTESDNAVSALTVVSVSDGAGAYEAREFCSPTDDLLLEVTDSVA